LCQVAVIFYNRAFSLGTGNVSDRPTATVLTSVPSNTTVLHGSTVIFRCSTYANPAAHLYYFYFDDALICNSSSGVLNVTVEVDGEYTCVPINTVSTGHNATVSVTAVGKVIHEQLGSPGTDFVLIS